MELVQIRYFITAAQFQNLSKAAHVLNITQPALSKSILKLEDELGVQLFDRFGKRLTLNESGEKFLEYALNSIQGLDDAVAAVNNQTPSPALHIGLLHYSERFMRCFGDFSKDNPDIKLQLERLEIATRDIDTNEFDALLYPQNPLFSKYRGNMIYSDPYLLAVHKSHPLAHKSAVGLKEITAEKVIFVKHGNKLFDLPYHLCISLGVRVHEGIVTNSSEIQRWMVANGHGVGFVPQDSSAAYAVDPDISLLSLAEKGLSQDIMIGFKREKHLSAAGRQFAAFVRGYFGL